MSNKEKFNGWTNYETWAVNLWIDNEEGTYNHWREEARTALNHHKKNIEDAEIHLADQLKQDATDSVEYALNEDYKASVYTDLLNSALSEVNWMEIAKKMIEEAKEEKKNKKEAIA